MTLFRSTAKANVATQLIMWFTGITAAVVIGFWFLSNNPFTYLAQIDRMDEDLLQLSQSIMHACNTMTYYSEYNPVTEKGFIDFRPEEICIRGKGVEAIQRCVPTLCLLNTTTTLELDYITYVTIEKNEGITVNQA